MSESLEQRATKIATEMANEGWPGIGYANAIEFARRLMAEYPKSIRFEYTSPTHVICKCPECIAKES